MPQFANMTSSPTFLCCRVSLVKFSYWSTFHVNIMTSSGIITILIYKELTRNPEIGNTLSEFVEYLEIGFIKDTTFGTNVSIKNYYMLQNVRITTFTISELLRENKQEVKLPPTPTRLGLKLK